MNIIYDTVPYGVLPVYEADDNTEYYSITELTNSKLVRLKNYNRVIVPLFNQEIIKEYKYSIISKMLDFVFPKSYAKLLENYNIVNKDIAKNMVIPNNILKLFEDADCNELRVISHGECLMETAIRGGISCVWSREIGYLGSK